MTGVGRELLPALYMQRWGLFFFFSHITKNRNPPPLHWPPHTFSFFFFPAFTGGYVILFVSLFRVPPSLPQHTQLPPPPGHAISHPSVFLSFEILLYQSDTRQFIPPATRVSHDVECQKKREKKQRRLEIIHHSG
jgi:hypothetical protein